MSGDPLMDELRALATALRPHEIPLIVGGGYGLYLKADYIRRNGLRTRLRQPPPARATADIDVFLRAEIISEGQKTAEIRRALDALNYRPIEGAKFYQFYKEIQYAGAARKIKFDFLAAPVTGEDGAKVKMDERRIRPRGYKGFHAHTTPEALTVEEHLLPVQVGEGEDVLEVYLPHPFSYILLKLAAFNDQCEREDKDFGRYHAFDVYTTWAMMTESEWDEAGEIREAYAEDDQLLKAGEIVRRLFGAPAALGVTRMREHVREEGVAFDEGTVEEFLVDLRELIGA